MSDLLEEYRRRLRQAMSHIEGLEADLAAEQQSRSEPIAILGMGCRFPPRLDSPDALFSFLLAGGDAIATIPRERLALADDGDAGLLDDPALLRAASFGGYLEQVDAFDADFFGLSPREAARMDPQQRLLLEVTHEALERAGQVPSRLSGTAVGVFVGMTATDYAGLSLAATRGQEDIYTATGNGHCFSAGRLSYAFGFLGPSIAVDTACSSSLVALHLACHSLRRGESSLAVAGGVNLILSSVGSRLLARSQALSPDGRCRSFDAAANGFVRGEGCGVVVLKRLSDAQRAGDPILALVRGSAVNQDGRSTGLTAPNVRAQQAMLRAALADAGLAADEIDYIETHGTGTPLGDPIELEALKAVLGGKRANGSHLVLGAVKTNLGHSEAAAGMAGLLKVVLSLQAQRIPRNLHYTVQNPRASLDGTPLMIPTSTQPWPAGSRTRRAGVSSFGLSGTNAHIVLEEAPASPTATSDSAGSVVAAPQTSGDAADLATEYLLPLSAKSAAALRDLARDYVAVLEPAPNAEPPGPALSDVLYTACQRRAHHEHRLAVLGGNAADLAAGLRAFAKDEAHPSWAASDELGRTHQRVVLVFSGQGAQWLGMGRQLLATTPQFRSVVQACDALVQEHAGWSLLAELAAPAERSRLDETDVAQPALLAIQVALARLVLDWGVQPTAALGHSVGEIAAAHIAGALSLADAVRLACARGRVMQSASGQGKMATVALPAAQVAEQLAALAGRVEIAAVNDPGSTVIAGEPAAIDALLARWQSASIRCRALPVRFAFHSPQMAPFVQPLVAALRGLSPQRTHLALYSTVTGARIAGEDLGPAYFGRNIREPVRFAQAIEAVSEGGPCCFVELSPHPVLAAHIAQCLQAWGRSGQVMATLRRDGDELHALRQCQRSLYVSGVLADAAGLGPTSGRVLALPTHRFARQRHWVETGNAAAAPLTMSRPLVSAPPSPAVTSPSALAAPPATATVMQELVQQEACQVLGREVGRSLPPQRGFFELGFDSLMIGELRTRLEARLGVPLPATVLFDHPTVTALSSFLTSERGTAVSRHSVAASPRVAPPPSVMNEPIAVVGQACRFPGGANRPGAFWELLRDGVDAISDVPPGRWDREAFYSPDPGAPGKMYVCRNGFLRDWPTDRFDAAFFNLSPLEAAGLDPQQRLLLELSWEALEDAGIPADRLLGSRGGVFVGLASADYSQLASQLGLPRLDPYVGTGTAMNIAAGRLAYFLGLHGPVMALDTACSSSLVAAHLACRSLRSFECDLALVGGVNLILTPVINVFYSRLRTLAPDGRLKAFDAAADGMVRGEGGAVLVLKRYRDALRDGEPILGLLRGSAVNHDGRSAGLTVPSGTAQRQVLRAALADAGLAPAQVSFVEAHGTGTVLGDPIELNALIDELGRERPQDAPLYVGSAKANVGHLEAAAGLVGLTKVLLALRYGQIPPQIHFARRNPQVLDPAFPLVIPTTLTPWPAGRRIAGVSAFGVSGTNAHLLVEGWPMEVTAGASHGSSLGTDLGAADAHQAPPPPTGDVLPSEPATILCLSARSPEALRGLARAYVQLLSEQDRPRLADLGAATLMQRAQLERRLAVVGDSPAQLQTALQAFLNSEIHPGFAVGSPPEGGRPRPVFVFSGHSGHWVGMGRTLSQSEPVFSAELRACGEAMAEYLPQSLPTLLAASESDPQWNRVEVLQPLVFAVQCGLQALLRSQGVVPAAVVGHSMGEIAAAYCAGALSLADAAQLICRRSALIARLQGRGAMAVVALSLEATLAALAGYEDRLAVAASNSPLSTLVSGDPVALDALQAMLLRRNVFVRRLNGTGAAGHSPQLDALLPELGQALAGLEPRPTTLPFYSTVTAAVCPGQALDAGYWVRNLREPVRFAQTIAQLGRDGLDAFVEIAPQPLLLSAIEQTLRPAGGSLLLASTLRAHEPERAALFSGLAKLWVAGVSLNPDGLFPRSGRRVELPTYPWQRQRHWLPNAQYVPQPAPVAAPPPAQSDGKDTARLNRHPLFDHCLRAARPPGEAYAALTLDRYRLSQLLPQSLQGQLLVPAALLVEIALAAAQHFGPPAQDLVDLQVHADLLLSPEGSVELQGILSPTLSSGTSLQILQTGERSEGNLTPDEPQLLASGQLRARPASVDQDDPPVSEELSSLQARCPQRRDGAELYARLRAGGLVDGAQVPQIGTLWVGEREALAQLLDPPASAGGGSWSLPSTAVPLPAWLIEAALQTLASLLDAPDRLPFPGDVRCLRRVERLHWLTPSSPGRAPSFCHARLTDPQEGRGEVLLLAADGTRVAELHGVCLGPPSRALARKLAQAKLSDWLYAPSWQLAPPVPDPATSKAASTDRSSPGIWLILADQGGLATALAHGLVGRGDTPILVYAGTELSTPEAGPWTIPIDEVAAYPRLLASAEARGNLAGILHLMSLDATPSEQTSLRSLRTDQSLGMESALHLLQAQLGRPRPTRLWWVTENAIRVCSDDPIAVAQAPLWGVGKALALEQPDRFGRLIDLEALPRGTAPTDALPADLLPDADRAGTQALRDRQAAFLLRELACHDEEDFVAERTGQRHVLRLQRSSEITMPRTAIRLHPDAAYLITGGLGGAGLESARWLVERGARHLFILGRSALPESAEAGAKAIEQRNRLASLDALRQQGAVVRVLRADVGDRARMSEVLLGIHREGLRLRGVLHAAGVSQPSLLTDTSVEVMRALGHPKIAGTWVLHELTRGLELDFFVCYSSAASIWGAAGLGPYAAANHFLDSFVHYRRSLGLPALSVNWGGWGGGGMTTPDVQRLAASMGLSVSAPEQLLEVLDALLQAGVTQRVVGVVNWQVFRPIYEARRRRPLLSSLSSPPPSSSSLLSAEQAPLPDASRARFLAELAALTADEAHERLRSHVRQQVAGVLGMDDVQALDPAQGFFQLGMDSILSVRLRDQLERSLGATLPPTLAVEHPTVLRLSEYLAHALLGLATGQTSPSLPPQTTLADAQPLDPDALDGLSEAQLEHLLTAELQADRGDGFGSGNAS